MRTLPLLLSAVGAGASLCVSAAARPNFLVILADDVDVESFEVYSPNPKNTHDANARIQTPRISSLAQEGVRFLNAFTPPLCTPSRCMLMSGQYNYRNYRAFGYFDNNQTTFAQVLRTNGYRTAVAGKWQLSDPDNAAPAISPSGVIAPNLTPAHLRDDYGFDAYLLWQLNYTEANKGSRYWNPKLETASPDGQSSVIVPVSSSDYGPDRFVSFLKSFISESVSNQQAFCAYYPMVLPHDPWVSTPAAVNHQSGDREVYWDDNVAYVDHLVGELVDHLDDPDGDPGTPDSVRDNTVVIFLADNGTNPRITVLNDARGLVTGDKGTPSFDGTHVPFIISWRNTLAPGVSDRMVDTSDVFPTLLELAGIIPGQDLVLDGQPILDATGGVQNNKPAAYVWYDALGRSFPVGRFAQNAEYKLYDDGRFYHVASDPLEVTNLFGTVLSAGQIAASNQLQTVILAQTNGIADRALAPRLDPGVWERAPSSGVLPGSSVMTAAPAADANGPVEWQFENTTNAVQSSWQPSRDYREENITPGGVHGYRLRARDLFGNLSAWSPIDTVSIVADPNPTVAASAFSDFDGDSGGFNLGQSFRIDPSLHGAILDRFRLWSVARTDGGDQWHLGIYGSFTNRTDRGTILAVSTNEVVNPRAAGQVMEWTFGNLLLESNRTYYAVVCDGSGQPLASGEGVPCQRMSTGGYPGGDRLTETGSDGLDLRFEVRVRRHPQTFDEWRLRLPGNAARGFEENEPANGTRYFFGEDGVHPLRIDRNRLVFPIAPGPSDVEWSIISSPDLMRPPASWQVWPSDHPGIEVDWAALQVTATLSDTSSFYGVRIQLK